MKYIICIVLLLFVGCGKQGATGSPGLNGAQGIQGTSGSSGVDGTNGATGQPGATGAIGPAGSDGTVITAVQFCPASFVPTYPTTFPEVGLCIAGSIYAVYSANGGFLTLITNGSYSSDGINASCNFTVSGCTVTQD